MSTDTAHPPHFHDTLDDTGEILETFDVFPGDLDFLAAFGEFTFDDNVRCFESEEAQDHWLNTANPSFEGLTPTEMLRQPEGLARVLNVLLARPMRET